MARFYTTDRLTRNDFVLRMESNGEGEFRVILTSVKSSVLDEFETTDYVDAYNVFQEMIDRYQLAGTPLTDSEIRASRPTIR